MKCGCQTPCSCACGAHLLLIGWCKLDAFELVRQPLQLLLLAVEQLHELTAQMYTSSADALLLCSCKFARYVEQACSES